VRHTHSTDLNLLAALDALLTHGSVAGAAEAMGLSASAMSRTLARIRTATGDPTITALPGVVLLGEPLGIRIVRSSIAILGGVGAVLMLLVDQNRG
jgi:DNA-binding transcriptional LysR family regulator